MRIETEPGAPVSDAWVYLTPDEAHDLLEALTFWASEVAAGRPDPSWHAHIEDGGTELTLAIGLAPAAD